MSLARYATEYIRHFQPQLVDMPDADTRSRSDQYELVRKLDDFHSKMKSAEKIAKDVWECVSDMLLRSWPRQYNSHSNRFGEEPKVRGLSLRSWRGAVTKRRSSKVRYFHFEICISRLQSCLDGSLAGTRSVGLV